ncbi:MAG: extracellular solute-binding protein [Lachnospiraceae bacterium]|nr:extracellular solute-binding protein [Lachnospiraceae bacterium]
MSRKAVLFSDKAQRKQRHLRCGWRAVILLLAAMLLLGGCGQSESGAQEAQSEEQSKSAESGNGNKAAGIRAADSISWKSSHVSLHERLKQAVVKDRVVYGYYMDSDGIVVVSENPDSGEVKETAIAGADSGESITVDTEGNIYVLGMQDGEYCFWEILPDGTVQELGDFELEDMEGEVHNLTPKGLYVDDAGYFYLWYGMTVQATVFFGEEELAAAGHTISADQIFIDADRIYVKDSQMNTVYYEQVPGGMDYKLLGVCFDENGVPALLVKDPDGYYMETLGTTQEACEKIQMEGLENLESVQMEYMAVTEGGFLYCSGSGVYQYRLNEQAIESLFDLTSFGISTSDILYMGVKDGAVEIVDHFGDAAVSEYTLIEEGESEQTIVTLGIVSSYVEDDFTELITAFNHDHGDIRIDIVNYYDAFEEDGFEGCMEQLELDIIQGTAPDILDVSSVNSEALSAMGAFEDLYSYMDQDEECGRDMLMDNILEAYEKNGALYMAAPTFMISSMWGGTSLVQGRYGVTLGEMMEILKEAGGDINSIFGFSADEPVLTTLCTMGMDEFIDWESGTCFFTGEAFRDVLEFAKEYEGNPASNAQAGIAEGEILLSLGMISSVAEYQIQCELYGETVEYIGYPTADGSGTAAYFRGIKLAINADSDEKEAAWEFVKYYLLNGYDSNAGGFPLVKEQFEEAMAEAMTVTYYNSVDGSEPEIKAVYQGAEEPIVIYKAEQEDVDAIRALVERADCKFAYQTEIQDIINEEADYYFAGQKDAEEVMELIQNRVSLYIAEQMN